MKARHWRGWLAAALLWTCAAQAAPDAAWRSWHADLLKRVYSTPRQVADEALQVLAPGGTEAASGTASNTTAGTAAGTAPADLRSRLQATVALATAAQVLSRDAQYRARDWLDAGLIAARGVPAQADLLVELLVLGAVDNLMQSRHDTARRQLDEAAALAGELPDAAHASDVYFGQAIASLARGDGAGAVRQLDEALERAPGGLHRAVLLTWQAIALRRFAQPASGTLRKALQQLDETRRLADAEGTALPVLRVNELVARVQSDVTLGEIKRATRHSAEVSAIFEALAAQGYRYPETSFANILAQFRREDLLLAERLQSQRALLLWGVGLSSLIVCVAITVLLMHFLQRRRLTSLSGELTRRNEELSELAKARTRLLAAACHDLRQPAHALSLSAELAMLSRADGRAPENVDEARRRLDSIARNTVTLTEMLGELMDQTRLAGGAYQPERTAVSLHELLQDAQLQFGELARRKGLALDIEDCDVSVRSDRHLLRRICFNLVSNAVKYTERGRVRVSVERLGPGKVRLAVQDTGPGIPAAHLETVFNDYVRLKTDSPVEGLGIGLAIVKRAADLLGHTLALSSEVGQGTTVTLTLDEAATEAVAPPREAAAAQIGAHRLVALLEDDIESRNAVAALLRQWGFEVVAATSADELAARLRDGGHAAPGLLITDLHLGALDGLEQACKIRSWPGCEKLPAVLVTGDLDPSMTRRAAELGIAVGHKPLLPQRLRALIQESF